jgi:hypothetical protein
MTSNMDHEEKQDDEYKKERKMKKKMLVLCEKEEVLLCSNYVIFCEKQITYKSHKNESDTSVTKVDLDCFM